MTKKYKKILFWFRRDLRLEDNVGLYNALKDSEKVALIFIFDKSILNDLPKEDKRVEFIYNTIKNLKKQLNEIGTDIIIEYDYSEKVIIESAKKFNVDAVYTNEDYEPFARKRDGNVKQELNKINIDFVLFKDTVIFHKDEILNNNKQPYTIFTQYKMAWYKKLKSNDYQLTDFTEYNNSFVQYKIEKLITLDEMGFKETNISKTKIIPSIEGALKLFNSFLKNSIKQYKVKRNIPSLSGISYLSLYNRFGLISIRYLINKALNEISNANEEEKESVYIWIDELIWREFYMQLMYHYPHVVYEPFKIEFKDFPWENNLEWFWKWCNAQTGFPIIDAAITQLKNTGYMHNRLRMVVASFLTKHLNIDYRLGEEFFAHHLLDFDLSANNGGWQWCASTGCDTQPYYRIFNPIKQSEEYDADAKYIKKYLPIFNNVPSELLHDTKKNKEEIAKYGIKVGIDYPEQIISLNERRSIVLGVLEEHLKSIKE